MKVEIKSRWSVSVLFSFEAENNSIRLTLETGFRQGADLRGANLYGANLRGADLRGANLRGADLYGADLRGANLYGANLRGADLYGANLRGADLRGADLYGANLRGADLYGADLRGADLYGADLRGADLYGANLRGAKIEEDNELVGERPFFTIGPIGSRLDILLAFSTQKGLRIRAGCFFGDKESFLKRLEDSHGDNTHGREYKSALVLIEAHFSLWNKES